MPLSKLVTRLLVTIHGQIKNALTTLIIKKISIMDALKPLIRSGMEVNSSHWTRFAFLVFLQELFSPYLIVLLYPDLQQHIKKTLKVNLVQLVQELEDGTTHASGSRNQYGINDTTHKDVNHTGSTVTINIENSGEEADTDTNVPTDAFVDADVDADADRISDEHLDPGCSTSDF
ncbi:hypothetical protein BDR04DRAFT_1123526 [Suillus decipiens]|nr:hypothetical protein BDR04DRAFT_1123526 [Suillus decipiens]